MKKSESWYFCHINNLSNYHLILHIIFIFTNISGVLSICNFNVYIHVFQLQIDLEHLDKLLILLLNQ